jgi:hypothetical protein
VLVGRWVAWQICSSKARIALSVRVWSVDVGIQVILREAGTDIASAFGGAGGLLVVALASIAEHGIPLACLWCM